MTHDNKDEMELRNDCTTLTSAFDIIEKVMKKEGLDPDLIQNFKTDWWSGAYDTIHVVLNLVKANDHEGLSKLHTEVHHYMATHLIPFIEEANHVKH